MGDWESIISGTELAAIKKRRKQRYITQTFPKALYAEKLDEGWELNKELKKSISLKKLKPIDEQFEDEVWSVFANLGFSEMNKDRKFEIQYDDKDIYSTKQIDVFAADSETVIVVECKTAETIKRVNFKEEIESWRGIKADLLTAIKKQYPESKVKFIFATKNCDLSQPDAERLKAIGFIHFDESDLKYYKELGKHLGICARFQLLGNLFAGQKIPSLNSTVPAIRGKMGGYTYYSFSIEPDRLLKIGYVLHRNNVNNDLMPTYQRLIKKERLVSIRRFINDGGFFPNSIVVNINTNGKDLQFDFAETRSEESIARLGLLHLPQEYRSAYIIDGQHRLYGYADSEYALKNCIPVVAFVDLPQKQQLQLFIDINENQKAVPKNLRLTLEDDLYWKSKDYNEQRQALRSRVAQWLGDDKYSPLHNRILIGENEKSHICCIAIKPLTDALSASIFFTKYGKNNLIIKNGTFDRGNNDATFAAFYPFLKGCFDYLYEAVPVEWSKGSQDNGVLTINIGMYALIRVINDVIDYLVDKKQISPTIDKSDYIVEKVTTYLRPIVKYYEAITPKERDSLKKKRGSGGMGDYWHTLQQVVSSSYPDFCPAGLNEWIFANKHVYNDETYEKLLQISNSLLSDVRSELINNYGTQWFLQGVPKAVYDKSSKAANDFNYNNASTGVSKEPWEFIKLSDCRNIIIKSGNWSELFESKYSHPSQQRSKVKKTVKTEWLNKLAKLSAEDFESYSVSEEEYSFVNEIYTWLILHQPLEHAN